MGPKKDIAKKPRKDETQDPMDKAPGESAEALARSSEPTEVSTKKGAKKKSRKNKGKYKYVGAHVSIAGGIWKVFDECEAVGGRSFGMFLGSQCPWKRPPLDKGDTTRFREEMERRDFDPNLILPHGSYLMNCGSPKQDIFKHSQALLVDELRLCRDLGLTQFNFHPGSSLGGSTEQCIDRIAHAINHAHQKVPEIVTVLENMCGQGNTIGGDFSELRKIIDHVDDKSRVGVCLDTCHAFAAGYKIASKGGVKKVLAEFNDVVGLQYLKAMHLNDSKDILGCSLDRHEDIGRGKIGTSAFREIMNEPLLDGIPLILETPGRPGFQYAEQIKFLYSLFKR